MKEFWVSAYKVDGTLIGGSYTAENIDDVEHQMQDELGDEYGGIADYGCYDDEC